MGSDDSAEVITTNPTAANAHRTKRSLFLATSKPKCDLSVRVASPIANRLLDSSVGIDILRPSSLDTVQPAALEPLSVGLTVSTALLLRYFLWRSREKCGTPCLEGDDARDGL